MVRAVWLGLVGLAFVAGLGMGLLWERQAPAPRAGPVCRPSSPAEISGPPAILFWGNSLAFDHGWRIPGHRVVNCARQGLTAQDAVPLTSALPDMDFGAIVLIFGTVELLRDTPDATPFHEALRDMLGTLRQRYPGTPVTVLTIPEGPAWRYADHPQLAALNETLAGLDGVRVLDTSRALAQEDAPSHDGIHPSPESYVLLEDALPEQLP